MKILLACWKCKRVIEIDAHFYNLYLDYGCPTCTVVYFKVR